MQLTEESKRSVKPDVRIRDAPWICVVVSFSRAVMCAVLVCGGSSASLDSQVAKSCLFEGVRQDMLLLRLCMYRHRPLLVVALWNSKVCIHLAQGTLFRSVFQSNLATQYWH